MKEIFKSQNLVAPERSTSLFSKERKLDTHLSSKTIKEEAIRKAEALCQKLSVFSKIPVTAKSIPPLNSAQLQKKQRQKEREATAGKGWGYMSKQELTEEVKRDLRTIQLRNLIYPNKFYKSNDSKKLPQYF